MTKKELEVELTCLQDQLTALDSHTQRLIVENNQLWAKVKKQQMDVEIDLADLCNAKRVSLRYQYYTAALLGTWLLALTYWMIT